MIINIDAICFLLSFDKEGILQVNFFSELETFLI